MRSAKQDFVADIAALKGQLSDVLATLATLARAASEGERGSFTLREFQRRHNLSESQFFKLCREGRGPRLMSVGAIGKRVSREADRDWVAAREQEAEAAKETAPIDNETSVPEGCPSGDDSKNIPFAAGRKDTVSRDLGGANAPRDDESVKENQRAAHCGPIARTNRVALK